MSESSFPGAPDRVPCGVTGLDTILGGGLFKAGIYILVGSPGSGKTTFANQACFQHVRSGGRAVYVTLLSETHGRMLAQMQGMTFFDRGAIGEQILYVNGFTAIEGEGLDGLLKLLRRTVRDHRADFLVLDGMVTASVVAKSTIDYKKFINELQTWVGIIGCTVLFLTSATLDASIEPEYTMVDGIFELTSRRHALQCHRQLSVLKFRGSGFVEGGHPYVITNEGLVVYPRVEGLIGGRTFETAEGAPVGSGIARFDDMLGGGFACGSTTLLMGPPGVGKTTFGLHFLAAGAQAGERALHFGFFENPRDLVRKGDRLGLGLSGLLGKDLLRVIWQAPAEKILDAMAYQLLLAVRGHGVKRLLIDGLIGFRETAYPERLPGFFSVLTEELRSLGVTTVITEESRELFVQAVPTPPVSAAFDNIVLLRHEAVRDEVVRQVAVLKTRDSAHERAFCHFEITGRGVVIGGAKR